MLYSVSLTLSIESNSEAEAIEEFLDRLSYNDFDNDSIDVEIEDSEDGDNTEVECGICRSVILLKDAWLSKRYLYLCNTCESEEGDD
jgi:hypothetical protein